MFDFMRSIKTEMQQLRESVDFCSNKITDFEANLTKINEYFKKTDSLKAENIKLKQDIGAINKKNHNLEQSLRSNNVEMKNLMKTF